MEFKTKEKCSINKGKILIKLCHHCCKLTESYTEPEKCSSCQKSFLPSNYFQKVHVKNTEDFKELFLHIDDLREEDLIKGYNVIW